MKLLITGGCGFVGSNLAANSLQNGHEVVIFDNLSREGTVNNLQWLKGMGLSHFAHGDIRNSNDITGIIKKFLPDAIFHLAGQVAMTTSITNPRMDFEINVVGSYNLLEAVRCYCPESSVIYSSSNKVYGNLDQFTYREAEKRYECVEKPIGFDESTQLDFHSPYGCSKGSADQYMLDYSRVFGLKTVVFRHSSIYGNYQRATYDQGWVGWFCQKALEYKKKSPADPFTISGNGKQVRDLLHIDDLIRLYFSTLDNIAIAKGNAFNIGGGISNSLSLLELFSFLNEVLEIRLSYDELPPRMCDQLVFIADYAKAERLLKWKPEIDKNTGITRLIEWINNERYS